MKNNALNGDTKCGGDGAEIVLCLWKKEVWLNTGLLSGTKPIQKYWLKHIPVNWNKITTTN